MTPFPRDASTRPASNCGLTRITSGEPGATTSPGEHGTARVTEMNERSAVTTPTGVPPTVSRVTSRMSRRSRDTTRGSRTEPGVELAPAHVHRHHRGRARPGAGSR